MERHLLTAGHFLTECALTAVVVGALVTDLEKVTCRKCRAALIRKGLCPECGSKGAEWSAGPVKLNGVVDGRLTMRDVETQFYLGCPECSATLISGVAADTVAEFLTNQGWMP